MDAFEFVLYVAGCSRAGSRFQVTRLRLRLRRPGEDLPENEASELVKERQRRLGEV